MSRNFIRPYEMQLTQTNYSGFYRDLVPVDQPILKSTHFEGFQTIEIHGEGFLPFLNVNSTKRRKRMILTK